MGADASYEAQLGLLTSDLGQLGKRLRSLSRRSWEPRRSSVVALLVQLADLCATAEQRQPEPIPSLPDHGLVDALAVIGGDLIDALSDAPSAGLLERAQDAVAAAWESTR